MAVKSFKEKIRDIKKSDEYWIEKALLDFSSNLNQLMEEKGVSRAEFARQIGKSNAYVSKALRGEENFTIKTMVKFARTLGSFLHLKIDNEPQSFVWREVVEAKREKVVFQPVYVNVVTGGVDIVEAVEGGRYRDDTSALAA